MTLWYVSRATGLIALALFTLAMALGALTSGRAATPGLPRFAVVALHRNASLLSLAFLSVHIGSAVIDSYVSIGWSDSIVSFLSSYQTLWIGLGTVAFDLLLAVLITTAVRTRIPLRLWQVVHRMSYLCWPIALAHTFGLLQSDANWHWILAFDIGCVLVVVAALLYRWAVIHPDTAARNATLERSSR
ncbi:MAG TPA: ferric reductase-like transmembrane domain-containing protein [Mycobacteriales bacterium]|nr:ferric reductase-like transmembrane domain-containing protein [Mycobacteriales bacterium]